jgi:tRNA-2-methylthio-N6-dimethylallyladenosine synthase
MDNLKKYYIKTYGCQMNELDSEVMAGILDKAGYQQSSSHDDANIIIFNTCSVRDIAEKKVFGKLHSLKNKDAIIGIAGCMSMTNKQSLLDDYPYIDFVLGTKNIHQLEDIIEKIISKKQRFLEIEDTNKCVDYRNAKRTNSLQAYVSIITGCNNFCTYCIVPHTRGRERSRNFQDIVDEVKKLANDGYKEITLLGQNVNSYGKDKPEMKCLFHDLLYKLDKVDGIERIRFFTSHPKDISNELIYSIADLKSVCEFIHFPMQAGSDRILKKMNRKYSFDQYLEKVEFIKKIIPDATIGTDIIVGFPTETKQDFLETLHSFQRIKFSTAFIFAYSPRKGTVAFDFKDDVSKEEKLHRLNTLLNLHKKNVQIDNKNLIGSTVEVLVEKENKDKSFLKAKDRCFRKVILKGNANLIGSIQNVKIENCVHQTLIGSIT